MNDATPGIPMPDETMAADAPATLGGPVAATVPDAADGAAVPTIPVRPAAIRAAQPSTAQGRPGHAAPPARSAVAAKKRDLSKPALFGASVLAYAAGLAGVSYLQSAAAPVSADATGDQVAAAIASLQQDIAALNGQIAALNGPSGVPLTPMLPSSDPGSVLAPAGPSSAPTARPSTVAGSSRRAVAVARPPAPRASTRAPAPRATGSGGVARPAATVAATNPPTTSSPATPPPPTAPPAPVQTAAPQPTPQPTVAPPPPAPPVPVPQATSKPSGKKP
jgi:hypothetical protein